MEGREVVPKGFMVGKDGPPLAMTRAREALEGEEASLRRLVFAVS